MKNDGNITGGSDQPSGGIPASADLQPIPQPGEVLRTVESVVTSSTATSQVGAKERNLMFLITGCSGLFLSNTMALVAVIWNFYNTSNGLPAVVLPEWAIGLIFSTYGSAVVVWLQNKIEKAATAKKAP